MIAAARYAYLQARLQARYGQLPGPAQWQRLRATTSLSHFLQLARSTGLRPWLLNIAPHGDTRAIERSLRGQLRTHVAEVARWLPAPWQGALHWCALLPDLPALHHLLGGATAPDWVLDDSHLRPLTHELMALRLQALRESRYAPLAPVWEAGKSLAAAWLAHWQTLWPAEATAGERRALLRLADLVARYHAALAAEGRSSEPPREWLEQQLRLGFRRSARDAAAAFHYLALVEQNLEQLRGVLTRLALFPPQPEQAA